MLAVANFAAAFVFIGFAMVWWWACLPMLLGSIAGGWLGALARQAAVASGGASLDLGRYRRDDHHLLRAGLRRRLNSRPLGVSRMARVGTVRERSLRARLEKRGFTGFKPRAARPRTFLIREVMNWN